MKTVGLIGGMSWVSTIEYYKAINEMTNARLGGIHFARCIIYSIDYHDMAEINKKQDWNEADRVFSSAAKNLESAGANCILLCANTAHMVAEQVQKNISIPLIHIGDATVKKVQKHNIKKIALLGTKFTMEKNFIKEKFAVQNIDVLIPEAADREFIHAVIFDELGKGIFKPETKKRFQEIIHTLVNKGAEGVILGCTEIPLLIKQSDVTVPVFDTTLIHSNAAVDFALGD
jgi:aspartate racemase